MANTEGRAFSRLDADTGLSARSYEIARLAAGGLLEAVDRILNPKSATRNPQSVFAFVRPPGHHAEPNRGMGFCLFNNIAIAAEYAIEKHGLKRILIVDWDLHHGNGTQKAFYDRKDVLFFSSHQYPHYPGTGSFDEVGSGKGEGFTVNAPFPSGFGDAEYLAVYERILRPIALEYKPELVLVSAGFDPYVKDPLGGMEVTGDGFGNIAFTGPRHRQRHLQRQGPAHPRRRVQSRRPARRRALGPSGANRTGPGRARHGLARCRARHPEHHRPPEEILEEPEIIYRRTNTTGDRADHLAEYDP